MAVEITANFENEDMAELALVRVHELGINPQSYTIQNLKIKNTQNNLSDYGIYGTYAATYPSTSYDSGVSVTNSIPIAPVNAIAENTMQDKGEVTLRMTVPFDEIRKAQSALISCHGYQVKQL